MDRRRFLRHSLLALPTARAATAQGLHLEEATLADLARGFQENRFTARGVAEWYLARIDAMDHKGPKVNAVIEINPDALAIADELDEERRSERPRGPLHGVPLFIKDNIDTADRMSTTAGSLALAGSIAVDDAYVVERLRVAGVVILGKTNLSEWANFRSMHSVSGWSARGGQTRNPYALDRNPSGSSSGSAAAVAANFSAVAVGTETDGSITAPASVCGIVGIKPTVGLVLSAGIVPVAHSQDTAGPIARTVRDAAILLSAMAAGNRKGQPDYTQFLDPRGLKSARIGVERKYFGTNTVVDRVMEACLAEMKRQGAELIDPANLPFPDKEYWDDEMEVLLYEFKAGVNAYLAKLRPNVKVRSLADVIAFNKGHREQEMAYFEQDLFERAQAKGPLTEKPYEEAREKCLRL